MQPIITIHNNFRSVVTSGFANRLMLLRGGKTLALMAISVLVVSAYAVRPAYAAGPWDFAASFLDLFEYKMDVDASELFPNDEIKNDLITKQEPRQFTIDEIQREIAGFSITASDVVMQLDPSGIDASNTRIDLDIKGTSVKVESSYLTRTYESIDVHGIYGVYNSETDNVAIHVPYAVALSLLLR